MEMLMLLVTGANGKLGRLIVEELLRRAPQSELAVSVRDPAGAKDLAERGVEVRRGDYDAPETLHQAFQGVDRLLLMPTPTLDPNRRATQHKAAVDAAADAGVGHIVYPSVHAVDKFDMPLLAAHAETERAIQASGVQWTMLRNAIYAEVVAGDVVAAIHAGELAAPAADAVVAPVLRRDVAVAAAVTLLGTGHQGRVYELTAPDTVSWQQLAQLAGAKAGKTIPYRPISDDEAMSRALQAGVPPEHLGIVIGFYGAYRQGWCATPSTDFQTLTGAPAATAIDAIEAIVNGTAY